MKHEEHMKYLLNQPPSEERNGRIQAILDLNNGTNKMNFARIILHGDYEEHEKIYYGAYVDTYLALQEGNRWSHEDFCMAGYK